MLELATSIGESFKSLAMVRVRSGGKAYQDHYVIAGLVYSFLSRVETAWLSIEIIQIVQGS